MAALATEARNKIKVSDEWLVDYAIEASEIIYQGAIVGDNGSGYAQAQDGDDPFLGIAVQRTVDNSGGSAGDKTCRVAVRGILQRVAVAGASDQDDIGTAVYAPTDNPADLQNNSTSADQIGKILAYHADDGTFDVFFEADAVRSI